jgi:hypothetical protein
MPMHGASEALESIERASIDMQISTAKKYPRTLSKVKADMLSFATLDEETASACFYTLPRGGKAIQGPSVRLAEIAVSSYGNLRAGSRVIATMTHGDNPHVVVQAVAHDLEKNTAITIEKRRRIVGKKRNEGRVDEDDINLACNACSAIAFRDAVFKIIPQALIKPVYEQAKKVAVGDVKSLTVTRSKVVDRLKQMGVSEARILNVVGARKAEDITQDKLEILIGLGTAIRDGDATIEEAFPEATQAPPPPPPPPGQTVPPPPSDEKAEAAAGLAPEQPMTEQPTEPANVGAELGKFMLAQGIDWETFRKYAIAQGWRAPWADADGFEALGMLATEAAEGFWTVRERIVKQIAKAKAEGKV